MLFLKYRFSFLKTRANFLNPMGIFHLCNKILQCAFTFRPEFTELSDKLKAIGASHVIKEEALRKHEIKELFKVCRDMIL